MINPAILKKNYRVMRNLAANILTKLDGQLELFEKTKKKLNELLANCYDIKNKKGPRSSVLDYRIEDIVTKMVKEEKEIIKAQITLYP